MKKLKPNVVGGGRATHLGDNLYYMTGRKHEAGGILIGKDLEVESDEVIQTTPNNVKVFSAQPILNGTSPAELVTKGAKPNEVFNAQENFKKANRLNDDGTTKNINRMGGDNKLTKGRTAGVVSLNGNVRNGLIMHSSTGDRSKAKVGTKKSANTNTIKATPRNLSPLEDMIVKPAFGNSTPPSTITPKASYTASTPTGTDGSTEITNLDKIGVAGNTIGTIAGGLNTIMGVNQMQAPDEPDRPIMNTAARLKTTVNVNPQIGAIRETMKRGLSDIDANTASSRTGLIRKQRARNLSTDTINQIYGSKENAETELINRNQLNRQQVSAQNVATYNNYLNNRTNARNAKIAFNNEKTSLRTGAINSMLTGVNAGLQDMVSRIEQRRNFNNNMAVMAASNPNVNFNIFKRAGIKI